MIGFFEHQYLSYKKNHIKNLLALAKVDGHIHDEEIKLLFKIGRGYGLKDRLIQTLIDSDEQYEMNIPDNYNDRLNLLYDLVLMIYADGVVDQYEVNFCAEAVKQFGLKKELLQYLLDLFEKKVSPSSEEWEEVKRDAIEKFKGADQE